MNDTLQYLLPLIITLVCFSSCCCQAKLVECPHGDTITAEPVLSLSDASGIELQSSITISNVTSSSECAEQCINASCLYAYHESSTNLCFVQPGIREEESGTLCQNAVIRKLSCDEKNNQCTRIARKCLKCGQRDLSVALLSVNCRYQELSQNYCSRAESEPFACPGASRNEYIDWYVDLDRLQLSLPDHFKKQEGIRSYSQCESQCHHRRACTEALFHNSTGTCFLAHFTRSAADRVCGRTANSILTQITCPTPGECLGMLKICENCGGASTADGLLHEAGCNAAIDLGHWCAMRNRYACQTNPLAKKCPVWVKEQYEQRATVVASTQNTAGLLRSFTSNNGAAADWTSIKNNADSNFSITLPIGPNKSFTFALPLKKLFGSFLGGKSPIQLIPSNPFASEHSRTTVSNSTEESTNSTLITDAQLTTTTINSISVADTNGTIVASNNTAS